MSFLTIEIDAADRRKIESMLRRRSPAEVARYTGFPESKIRHIRTLMPQSLEPRRRSDGSASSERATGSDEFRSFCQQTAASSAALLRAIQRSQVA